jgi:DNA-binding beta-propeller fold protein YncE
MRHLFLFYGISLLLAGCQGAGTPMQSPELPVRIIQNGLVAGMDTTVPNLDLEYSTLTFINSEKLTAAPGTKSVLFNSRGSRLFAMNLEGMSIYEFEQHSRKIIREFKFTPTRGKGWDYVRDKPIPSFQEKPVEACFSHDDRILWVSLHNAEGIVPIRLDDLDSNRQTATGQLTKKLKVRWPGSKNIDSFFVPLIKTGKTPKVISRTGNNKYLLVSNWHSYNVSVLELNINKYPYGRVVTNIPVSSIPRGIAVNDKLGKSYIAIMGGASIAVVLNSVWMKEDNIAVAANPRHIVIDNNNRLFVSYNSLGKIACIEAETWKTLFTASTNAQPRTIVLSKNQKFLFVTCYSSDYVDVFKINEDNFEKIGSFPCKGHPVGVDIFENEDKLEAWVCSYSNGMITVYNFRKD